MSSPATKFALTTRYASLDCILCFKCLLAPQTILETRALLSSARTLLLVAREQSYIPPVTHHRSEFTHEEWSRLGYCRPSEQLCWRSLLENEFLRLRHRERNPDRDCPFVDDNTRAARTANKDGGCRGCQKFAWLAEYEVLAEFGRVFAGGTGAAVEGILGEMMKEVSYWLDEELEQKRQSATWNTDPFESPSMTTSAPAMPSSGYRAMTKKARKVNPNLPHIIS